MKFTLERVTQPDIEPVTLAEAKRQIRAFDDVTDEDDDIAGLITSAREWAENYTGRALIEQEWRLTVLTDDKESKIGAEIPLRRSPALSITEFVTVDADGAQTVVDSDTYILRDAGTKWPRVVALTGATWPAASEIRIKFRAGYVAQTSVDQDMRDAVPMRIRQAIRLHVEAHYDRDPDMMVKLLKAAENLIRPERVEMGFA